MSATRRTLAAALLALAVLAATASGTSLPDRTFRVSVSPALGDLDGDSGDTSLSADGYTVAFASTASGFTGDDANAAARDVFTFDVRTGERRLVSAARGGANGPSSTPVLSADGGTVAFVSSASNLVAGDSNGASDVFVRTKDGPIARVSAAPGGGDADGPSSEPDLSADGRYVAFTSSADDLVPGDTNGRPDVFVHDLRDGTTIRVSVGSHGEPAGASTTPAMSADGRSVSFASSAPNLVAHDTNGVADVFVTDLDRHRIERVSVSSRGRQQNAAVTVPFSQVSDVSRDGRYVVFDSDATNLVRADANRHTDVFLRDRRRDTTRLISASSLNVQGNNDSFSPLMTPNGRYVGFQSFATNMAPGDGPREDVFVRDLHQGTTSVVGVAHDGAPRGPELVSQLLQRPALSADARIAAFSSTAENLVAGDANRHEDVFLRLMDAPQGRLANRIGGGSRPIVDLAADDPAASAFVCRVDRRAPFFCARGRTRMPRLPGGRHRLTVRAGGPGMLFDPEPLVVHFGVDHRGPRVRIGAFGSPLRTVRGAASDRSGIRRVLVAVTYFRGGCLALAGRAFRRAACTARIFQRARGRRHWSLRLPAAIRGPVVVYARAIDRAGNKGPVRLRKGLVR